MAGIQKLLFVDANIWLDFYRARTEAALSLLKHLEAVSAQIIVTHQLEMEFKKNRQAAMLEGMQELKAPTQIPRPGLFSDAKAVRGMQAGLKKAETRVRKLKDRMARALEKPTISDPVFKVCQRIFHKSDDLVLMREDPRRHAIRRKAFRRFILGYPPRKKTDTSIGDAVNWEWMIACAIARKAALVIVSRDADYGVTFENRSFINDHLRHEYSDRVSRKREILLFSKLSEALKLFKITITAAEEEEERLISAPVTSGPEVATPSEALVTALRKVFREQLYVSGSSGSAAGSSLQSATQVLEKILQGASEKGDSGEEE